MKLYKIITIVIGALFVACTGNTNLSTDLDDASTALADGDYAHAQSLCNQVMATLISADSMNVSTEQAVQLAMMYMQLSDKWEGDKSTDNVASATQCFRFALRHSTDSLESVSSNLAIEDVGNFTLLRRLTLSIDSPVDLTDLSLEEDDAEEVEEEQD